MTNNTSAKWEALKSEAQVNAKAKEKFLALPTEAQAEFKKAQRRLRERCPDVAMGDVTSRQIVAKLIVFLIKKMQQEKQRRYKKWKPQV